MAPDSHAHSQSRVVLSIDGDELTWTVRPKGVHDLGLLLSAGGLIALAAGTLLAINVWEQVNLEWPVRVVGAGSVAIAGLSLMLTLVCLALRDGSARATVHFDGERLTVREREWHRERLRQWSRDEMRDITVGHYIAPNDLLALAKSAGLIRDAALHIQRTAGGSQPVLGQLGLNGELTWLAAILRERLKNAPGRGSKLGTDVLVEIDPHLAEGGGKVAVPVPGPNGGGWGTVLVTVPPGAGEGTRLPLPGLAAEGGDLHVRLRLGERDERVASFELARHFCHEWEN